MKAYENDESFYVAFKVKDMPVPIVDCVRRVCSGGCGEEVWLDESVESVWSGMKVLCTQCAMELMGFRDFELVVAPETVDSIRSFLREHIEALRKLRDSN